MNNLSAATNNILMENYKNTDNITDDIKIIIGTVQRQVYQNVDKILTQRNWIIGYRIINGIVRKNYTTPSNAYFTLDDRFNKFIVEIEISDNEEKQKQLDFEFVFKLQNAIGYKYADKIDVTFEKMEDGASIWKIRKYNTMFLKWNQVK